MALTQEFKSAVDSGDVLMTRIMLKDIMLFDPTLKEFNEMEKYASLRLDDLYVQHDGEEFITDKESWNKDYLSEQMVAVIDNFSRERISLLTDMVKELYKDRIKNINSEKKEQQQAESQISKNQLGKGLAVGGVIVAAAGAVMSETAVAVVGVAAAAVGVVLIAAGGDD